MHLFDDHFPLLNETAREYMTKQGEAYMRGLHDAQHGQLGLTLEPVEVPADAVVETQPVPSNP